ncbi:MAG: family 16 glycosylhydrolase [Spirochaetales bacterium]|nr:family 16 glycosylhydrolase [Spirochaetales bacterium]
MKTPVSMKRHLLLLPIIVLLIISLGTYTILSQATTPGDVNSDSSIDIVDALLVAQYYVGLNPGNFNATAADVDGNGSIDIVDALLIARFYVGLINEFPGQTPTPTPDNGGYSFTGVLNDGYIDGSRVAYTTTATFDGSIVTITFDGGAGFEWAWLYTPDHHTMTNTGGNIWSATLSGYSAGSTLEYYFTVRKNGQEANNNDARHIWIVGTGSPDDTPAPTPTQPGITPDPTTVPGDYVLVWSDEFENTIGPDWVFETGNGDGGWGNNELEYYRQENAYISNGQLVIEAKQENYGGCNYTSARMKTQGKKSWCYGRIEARIKLPMGQGIWPAFWMLGDNITSVNWPACGEIDIMEHINNETQVHGTIHWDSDGYVNYGNSTSVNAADYHVYSIEWDSSAIKWFVDGNQYSEANILNNINSTHEFHNNFFILLNCAVGGNWPGSPDSSTTFPGYMYVDYVRVWQQQ